MICQNLMILQKQKSQASEHGASVFEYGDAVLQCESKDWDNWVQNHVEDIDRKMYQRQGTNIQVGFIDIFAYGNSFLRQ